ncbi:MarR family transcriptional regulator [Spongiactinospora rosea]|uniref:MarR family transcriptional regulator n=1 Tax=Spongiactinospora rosea TaxID=2248750 RepID=A0A366LT57_9ACTN|nr:MarR family transcriptional regulator [Spongiactinospora rosea]RBQ16800.1 MarR family transcriptional regulator [Spongiactinospora rosea]
MSGSPRLTETETRAWNGLLETYDLLHRLVEGRLREDGGVTQVQYEILHRVREHPATSLCITELATMMVTSRSGLSYQIAQLEKAGLLRRETDPDDERKVLMGLTPEGRAVLERTTPGHVGTVRAGLLDALTEEQVGQLAEIMQTTGTHLRKVVTLPPPRKPKPPFRRGSG